MEINNLHPHWIIDFCGEDNILKSKVNEALSSFSILEIEGNEKQWWVTDSFKLMRLENPKNNLIKEELDAFIISKSLVENKHLVPIGGVEPRIPLFNQTANGELVISLLGNLVYEDTRKYIIPMASRLKNDRQYAPTINTITVNVYIFIPQRFFIDSFTEVVQKEIAWFFASVHNLQDVAFADRFNLYFYTDQNKFNENEQSLAAYTNLAANESAEQIALTVLHHAITGEYDTGTQNTNVVQIFNNGMFGLFLDQNYLINKKALHLFDIIIENFKNNNSLPWTDESAAKQLLNKCCISDVFNNERISDDIHSRISNARLRDSRILNTKVSKWLKANPHPWDIFNIQLIKLYFLSHIKTLPRNLNEYFRLYLTQMTVSIKGLLDQTLDQYVNKDGNKSVENEIVNAASSVWSHDSENCGLKQFDRVINLIKEKITEEKADLIEFRQKKLHEWDIFVIPKGLEKKYNKYKTELLSEQVAVLYESDSRENADKYEGYESIEDKYFVYNESKIIDRLSKRLARHPVPLGLFMKSIMLGTLMAVIIYSIIRDVPGFLVNIKFLAEAPFKYTTIFILFIIPVFIAWWRYQITTLNHINKGVREYAALTLAVCNHKLNVMVGDMMDNIYDKATRNCNELLAKSESFRKSNHTLPYLNSNVFPGWRFMKSLDDSLVLNNGENKAFLNNPPYSKIKVANNEPCRVEQLNEQQKQEVLKSFIHSNLQLDNNEAISIWKSIILLPENVKSEDLIPKIQQLGIQRCKSFIDQPAEQVSQWLFANNNLATDIINHMLEISYPSIAFTGNVENIFNQAVSSDLITNSHGELRNIEALNVQTSNILSLLSIRKVSSINTLVFESNGGTNLNLYLGKETDNFDTLIKESLGDNYYQHLAAYICYLRDELYIYGADAKKVGENLEITLASNTNKHLDDIADSMQKKVIKALIKKLQN